MRVRRWHIRRASRKVGEWVRFGFLRDIGRDSRQVRLECIRRGMWIDRVHEKGRQVGESVAWEDRNVYTDGKGYIRDHELVRRVRDQAKHLAGLLSGHGIVQLAENPVPLSV